MAAKQLYYGEYNWFGEVHKFWTHAKDSISAHTQFTARLAKLLKITSNSVRCYYSKDQDNFKIVKKRN